jgi:hypothetical protein
MTYVQMDHARWVESNNRSTNKMFAKRRSHTPAPEHLSDFQAKVMDILGMVCGGIYNAPISWEKVEWQVGRGVAVVLRDNGFATWDFSSLTRLVFLCHEARIRCDITSHTRGYFRLFFTPRNATGGMAERHPNLDEAVAAFREYLPADHRIVFQAEAIGEAA